MSDHLQSLDKFFQFLILPAISIRDAQLPEDGRIACFRQRLQVVAFNTLVLRLNSSRNFGKDAGKQAIKFESRVDCQVEQLMLEVEQIGTPTPHTYPFYHRDDLNVREKIEFVGHQMVDMWFVGPLTEARVLALDENDNASCIGNTVKGANTSGFLSPILR